MARIHLSTIRRRRLPVRTVALGWLVAVALPGCGLLMTPTAPPPAVSVEAAAPPAPPPKPAPSPVPEDARPRVERISSGAPNHVYEIKGERYAPENSDVPMYETGLASWYGPPFHGRRTATGERYDMNAMTAAHKTMPLPSYALVRNPANGRQVVVRVNDRGPFVKGRVIDLSRAAARKLRINGLAHVEVRRLTHDEIRSGAWNVPVQRVAAK